MKLPTNHRWPWNWPWSKILSYFISGPKKEFSKLENQLKDLPLFDNYGLPVAKNISKMPKVNPPKLSDEELIELGNEIISKGYSKEDLIAMGLPEETIKEDEVDMGDGTVAVNLSVTEIGINHYKRIRDAAGEDIAYKEENDLINGFMDAIVKKNNEAKAKKSEETAKKKVEENSNQEYRWENVKPYVYILHTRFDLNETFYKITEAEKDDDPRFDAQQTEQGLKITMLSVRPTLEFIKMGVSAVQFQKERPFMMAFEFGECFSSDEVKDRILSKLGINVKPLEPGELEKMYLNSPDEEEKTDEPAQEEEIQEDE